MKYIDDLAELEKLVEESEEPIVYPIRDEGITFLDYFRYANKLYRYDFGWSPFLCIAKENLPQGLWIRNIQGLATIPLRFLVHFKDSGDFFVAAPAEQIEHITKVLEDFGCKNIFIATDKVIAQIENKISEFRQSGRVMDWHMNYFMKKLDELEFRVTEQIEVRDKNTKAFEEYRNAFRDKKVVIVAGGPTTKYYKPIPDAVHIGVNFAWRKEAIQFDYLFSTDYLNWLSDVPMETGFDKVRDKIFIGNFSYNAEWLRYPENYSFMKKNIRRFCVSENNLDQTIYQDICRHPLAGLYTIVSSALQFALFTYPKEIYLVGCDVSREGHFYEKKSDPKLSAKKEEDSKTALKISNDYLWVGGLKNSYARMKMFAEQYYPDTEIISVNPVGLKGLFRDIYTEDYKKFLQEV